MNRKESGRKDQQEMDIWNGVILASMWRIYLICLVVQLLCLFTYKPTPECSYPVYLGIYFLLPVVAQGILLLFLKLFVRFQREYLSDYALDVVAIIVSNLFIAVMVLVHSNMSYITVLLMAPITLVSVYKMPGLIWVQLIVSVALYVASRIPFLPPVTYWMDEIPGLKIVTFLALALIFAAVEEQVRKSTLLLDVQVWKDSLTHLYNHEAFYEELEDNMEKYEMDREPFSILIADIDNFKMVNDTYGHAYGDEVIRAVAQVMEKNRGSRDFAARYGGEEFAMILPRKQVSEAILMADKIRREFGAINIESKDGPKSFSISIGVAEYNRPYRTSSSFFEEADRALYEAKASGKNRVCCNK